MYRHFIKKRGRLARGFIFILVPLLFILMLPPSLAYFYTITTQCEDEPCVVGQQMNWTVVISNEGKKKLEYSVVEILDAVNGTILAFYDANYNPLSDKRGEPIPVHPKSNSTLILQSLVPKTNVGSLITFYPCFTNIIDDTYILAKYGEYETRHCYIVNQTLYAIGCFLQSHCPRNAYCSGNTCLPLECGACQYISNHTCKSYPCCADEDCSYNSYCLNRICLPITCLETQYLFNRTCIDIQCADNEILLNKSCSPLECEEHEQALNHTCVSLECNEDEALLNHTCVALGCTPYEFASNHSCLPLDCAWNQGYSSHACIDLDCAIYQDIDNHRCVNNKKLIIKLGFEGLALLLILGFLGLDIWKSRHRNDKSPKAQKPEKKDFPALKKTQSPPEEPKAIPEKAKKQDTDKK